MGKLNFRLYIFNRFKILLMFSIIIIIFIFSIKIFGNKKLTVKDIEIYKSVHIWELAQAVEKEDLKQIKKLANNENINLRDSIFDCNLLTWSIYNDKFESFKLLLKLGADPNYYSSKIENNQVINPIIITSLKGNSDFSFGYNNLQPLFNREFTDEDMLKYAEIILKYSKKHVNCDTNDANHPISAMYHASGRNHEVFKLLLKNDGNPYFICNKHFRTPIKNILTYQRIDNLNYAIYNNYIDIYKPISYGALNKPESLLFNLRYMEFKIGSPAHKMKMELIDFLKTKGFDYKKEPIPSRLLREKKTEYLEQY